MLDTSKIQMFLDKVQVFLERWLDCHLKRVFKSGFWQSAVLSVLTPEQRENVEDSGARTLAELDFATLIAVFLGNFKALRHEVHLDPELSDMAKHIKKIRNLYAHKNSKTITNPNPDKVKYHVDTLYHFLEGLGADSSLLLEVNKVKEALECQQSQLGVPAVPTLVTSSGIKINVSRGGNIPIPSSEDKDGDGMLVSRAEDCDVKKHSGVQNSVPVPNLEPLCVPVKKVEGYDLPSGREAKAQGEDVSPKDAVLAGARHEVGACVRGLENHRKWDDKAGVLFEEIKVSLKEDFPDKHFGRCVLLRVGDVVPTDIKLYDGWQCAIVLKINENNPEQVAQQISSFNKSTILPYMVGGCAVWQFPQPVIHAHSQEKQLNTMVFLPKWLTNYLYVDKGLSYCPNCVAVQNNLHADSSFSFQYLATYFPRTFAEVGAIFDWLFSNGDVQCKFLGETIFILDVGCGSGAATLSLIWFLKKLRCDHIKKIVAFGLDGNKNFLDRFKEMVPVLQENWKSVILEVRLVKVENMIDALMHIPHEARFDFIVSSKFVQEIEQEQPMYSELTNLCLKKLKKNGALCMLENYRADCTEKHGVAVSRISGYKKIILDKTDFTIRQIPNCPEVHESVGCQLLLNLRKEVL